MQIFPNGLATRENLFWDSVGHVGWAWLDRNISLLLYNLLHLMMDTIKQQITFTTITAANVEVIASYTYTVGP